MKKKFSEQAAELDLLLADLFRKWPTLHPNYYAPNSFAARFTEANKIIQEMGVLIADQVAPLFKQAANAVRELMMEIKRADLFYRLTEWRVPFWLAHIIVERCPVWLLPDIDSERWTE